MSRAEFIEKLEYLLQDLSQEDREDGISFYRDYLDEAGTEREQEVLREFGSPERIASIIRSNLQVDLEDGGIFSENGFEDERFREPGYQVIKRKDLPDVLEENRQRNDDGHAQTAGREQTEYEHGRSRKKAGTRRRILLPLLLVLVLFPVILGMGSGAIAAISTLLALIAIAVLGIGFLTIAACFGTVILTVMGASILVSDLWGGITVVGFAVFTFGCVLIGIALSILTYGKFVPWCIRTIVNILKGLLRGGKKAYEKLR